ncbi:MULTISPECIES: ABC transporter ATP-binding protein [unclassified Clostridium]|jgi:ABC-type multidrug/protein/lipid transport system|uniref:ABC transporter ATP-binding protein n=1 Tax=unclassified Clostridium TaxID=2614128 RepID=UPI0025C3EEE0|nr:ABC transporter ATP-binding protein [Clostridium sp.]MCI6692834.1 ABC transporter ATP-binding protein/permease [Clostridium sp.]MDY2631567.1 ABC transporter ATP-binding protein [Clostridium sp.]MDY4252519.1 ABC transporter ATP-binding protein [Clostridium sp.]
MIKKLSSYIGEYKKDSILTPVFVACEVVLEVIIPVLMAKIVDNGIQNGDMKYVTILGIIMLVMAFLSLTFGALGGKTGAKASTGFAKNLRREMFYKIQDYSFSNIDKYSTAGLITRLTTDVTNVQNAYLMIIRSLARAPFMLIAAMIMSFYVNAKMALIFLFAAVFLSIALYLVISKAHPIFKRVFRKYDDLNASVQENLTGIRAVKAYVREEHEISKFHKASQNLYNKFLSAEKIIILNAPIMQFTAYAIMLFFSWFGAKLIVSNNMTTGELMSLFTYTGNILMSLMMISMVLVMITMAKSSAERIVEVISEESDLKNCDNPIYEVKDGSIKFENVNFSYNNDKENLNLENINLTINSGETIGIIGGTGSAKSTFVQLIPRLYDVTSGSIKVGGIDVRDYDIETLRNEVSMVLQKNVLFSGTIKENLRWGNKEATDEEIIKACEAAQASEFIETFKDKYDTFIEQGGTNVSGGQKQRLTIARALLKSPKILILDDSTSAVDTKTDALIRKSFKESIPNVTKIIVAQRISSVEDADKIIVLNDGKIDGIGTHEELLKTNDIYREVYEGQMKGADSDEA